MDSQLLCRELSRLIFSSIGAIPEPVWLALTSKELLRKEKITVEINGKKELQGIWFGEVTDAGGSCVGIITASGTEWTVVFQHKDMTLGLRFDWNDDDGLFLSLIDDKWVPLTLSQKMMVGILFNDMVQEGSSWEVPINGAKTWPELHERLLSLIEHEENSHGEVDTEEKTV
jgi:hypothetical protein